MTEPRSFLVVLLAVGCSGAAAPPPPSSTVAPPPSSAPPPSTTTQPPPPPISVPSSVVPSPTAGTYLPVVDGLVTITPDAFRGPPIRLRSTLDIGTRDAAHGRHAPTVAFTDPATRDAFDAAIEPFAYARLHVEIATETLVAVTNTFTDENMFTTSQSELFEIAGGTVTHVDDYFGMFLEGANEFTLLRRIQLDPQGGSIPIVFTATGVEVRYPSNTVHAAWRSLAPLLRADTALGRALAAEGLVLPPPGTPFPPAPPTAAAYWASTPEASLARWLTLPADLRAIVRFVSPGGQDDRHQCALVFPPGTSVPTPAQSAYYAEPLASIALARATETLALHLEPGGHTDLPVTRPAGTLVAVASGMVDRTDSELARGHWAYVATGGRGGWVTGRSLTAIDARACPDLALPGATGAVEGGIAEDGHLAWFLAQTTLSIYTLDGCTLGPLVRTHALDRPPERIEIARTAAHDASALFVVWMGSPVFSDSRVIVVDAAHDEPLLRLDPRDEIELDLDHGEHRAPGWFPLRVTHDHASTYYRWDGGTLVAVAP